MTVRTEYLLTLVLVLTLLSTGLTAYMSLTALDTAHKLADLSSKVNELKNQVSATRKCCVVASEIADALEDLVYRRVFYDPTPRIGIVIAMSLEAEPVLREFVSERNVTAYGFLFMLGTIRKKPVVVTLCGIGEEAAAAATLAMVSLFNLKWAVNIGTSGAHNPSLDLGDVVIGAKIVNYGARRYGSYTDYRFLRLGITWSNGTRHRFLYLNSTPWLVELARNASEQIELPEVPGNLLPTGTPRKPKIVVGTIASSDLWTANATLITEIRKALNTDAEEMEAYGFGLTCYRLGVPFLKIAVISNSELTGSKFTLDPVKLSMSNGAELLYKMIELSP